MWLSERDDWKKRMYKKNTTAKEDAVKRNVSGLKNNVKSSKPEVNKPLKLKKLVTTIPISYPLSIFKYYKYLHHKLN